jgi:uncharacterized protein
MLAQANKAAIAALLWLTGLVALCSGQAALAQALQPVPPLTARVVDLTGTLDAAERQALEGRLQAFEQRKGSQIAVLIVPRTAPETIEQYGIRVAEQWKIGRSKVDDGAILLVAKDERALRIEVGYGLEGALNDATAKRIVADVITPRFRNGDFAGGIDAGVDAMLGVIDGEPLPEAAPAPAEDAGPFGLLPLVFVGAMMLGGLLRALLGRGKGALAAGGLLGIAAWLLSGTLLLALIAAFVGFIVTLAGGQMGSGWRGGYRGTGGGWGGGGGGGGGFRGGGGGFGGGGASGRW